MHYPTYLLTYLGAKLPPDRSPEVGTGNVAHIGRLFWSEVLRPAVEETCPYNTHMQFITTNAENMWSIEQTDNAYDIFPEYIYLGKDLNYGLYSDDRGWWKRWVFSKQDDTLEIIPLINYLNIMCAQDSQSRESGHRLSSHVNRLVKMWRPAAHLSGPIDAHGQAFSGDWCTIAYRARFMDCKLLDGVSSLTEFQIHRKSFAH